MKRVFCFPVLPPPAAKALLVLLVLCTLGSTNHAIIMRHDNGYSGYVASESLYPAVFYLHRRGPAKICVATLIHPRWAITAAHCTEETPLIDRLTEDGYYPVSIAGNQARVDLAVLHPDYDPGYENSAGTPDVDLALLRLEQEQKIPPPIQLYREQDEHQRVVTLLGWGFSGLGTVGSQRIDGQLRLARNRIDTADHRLRFTFDDPRPPHSAALDLEGMPGLGDSGGPALFRIDGQMVIAGVAVGELMQEPSEGLTQGLYGSIGVYERLSLHLSWIEEVISLSGE